PDKAVEYYRKVRALAEAGFADSLGLAAASLGQEARLCLNRTNYEAAIELYLQQRAAGDDTAENSICFTVRGLVSGGSERFAALVENPITRRVVTAYIISTTALKNSNVQL